MKSLYYPYFQLSSLKANWLASCFSDFSIFCPLPLRPSFSDPVKFIDPLPEKWQRSFKGIINEYRLFSQMYEDKSVLEFLKHQSLVFEDEERTSLLISNLKGFKREKTEFPNILAASLFLWLAQEYRIGTLSSWEVLKHLEKQEETLTEILGSDIEEVESINERIDYIHPDEGISPFLKKILRAFAYLLEDKGEFSIMITDDKDIHEYIKNNTENALIYQIYASNIPSVDLKSILEKIINTKFSKDYPLTIKEILAPYQHKAGKTIELLILPEINPSQHLLWLTGLKKKPKNAKNGIYAYIKD